MKKITSILLAVLMIFSLIGCGNSKENEKDAKIAELESQLAEKDTTSESAAEQTEKETTEQTTKEVTEATTTEKETEKTSVELEESTGDIGTRRNPAPFNTPVVATAKTYRADLEYSITLSDLVRGAEAETLALENNRFNEWGEDEEPIIFTATFELLKYESDEDEPYYVSKIVSFDFFTSSYSEHRSENVISLKNDFAGEVYEGGTVSGYVGGLIPKGDQTYIVFEENVWFQLPEQ